MDSKLDPMHLPPGTLIHGWRVVAKLGQGSYGAVYQVEMGGQHFALKIALHRASSGDAARTDARIRRELACLSLLNHPHIVRVWGHGRWPDPQEGLLFIIMDLVVGSTLAEWMEAAHPTFRQMVKLVETVADALAASHALGIFHRDIKPSNILVRKSDNAPIVTDYSVGDHPLAEELTEGPLPPGTRRYRSPEALAFERQHRNQPEARYPFQVTDELFALGATLYDLLTDPLPTGRHPRQPLNSNVLPVPSPAKVNPRVPPALSDLTMALLNPDPRVRPPDAGAVRRMLGELKADPGEGWDALVYPPSARRATAIAAPKARSGQRWRRASALIGAGVLALLLGAIVSSARWRDAEPQPVQAEPALQEQPLVRGGDVVVEPPASPMPQRSLPGSTSPPSQKENNAVNLSRSTPEASAPLTPARNPQPAFPLARPKPSFKQCTALIGALAFLKAGCATVHLRPEPGACPEEALKAMGQFHMPARGRNSTWIQPDWTQESQPDPGVYESGPIIGKYWGSPGSTWPWPEGTLLEGHLWVSAPGDRVFGHYTRARLPDGKTVPICLEICTEEGEAGVGWEKQGPGPREGTVLMRRLVPACWTDRWH
ncbi:serine/threonine protein kinase [Hyalangium sp.]|uniref:serine/threonine protein kinase n=1 Tax=Hyalangium sp. TaxID=2028555 RepID=UPI002D39E766|nr:protein kinase [Hyalangium sp.]HYH96092.1 protein kinase [Hyalangium sp.]